MVNISQGQLGIGINNVKVAPTYPASPVAGDCVIWNNIAGVAANNLDTDGLVLVITNCIADLPVDGVDQSGNSAVAPGDNIYYTTGDTIKLSKKNTGLYVGKAYSSKIVGVGGTPTRSGTLVASGNHVTTIAVWVGAPKG